MMTKEERRAIAAVWRVQTSIGEEQYRALNRLSSLVGEVATLDVWLSTKPDPVLVNEAISRLLLKHSPLFNMTPTKKTVSWTDVMNYRPRLEVLR